jgi:predicted  nucleic acid-binding Zn-ribbon protein
MSRQINMDIFNETYNPPSQGLQVGASEFPTFDGDRLDPQYDDLASKVEKLRYEVAEWIKSLNLRLEKALQKSQSIEERIKVTAHDTHDKMATLYSRIKENQNSDLKFQALIERHNQIVQSFDLRLSQSQRLIENQALQLAKQQDLIDDARRQLEKLKKL